MGSEWKTFPDDGLVDVAAVALALHVSRVTVRRWVRLGTIPFVRTGSQPPRFDLDAVTKTVHAERSARLNPSHYWPEDEELAIMALKILKAAAIRVLSRMDPSRTGFVTMEELVCEGWWRSFRYASNKELTDQFLYAVSHMQTAYNKLRYNTPERNYQPAICCIDDIDDIDDPMTTCDPTRPLEERELLQTALTALDVMESEVLRLRFGLHDGDEWGIVRVAHHLKIGRLKANDIQATALAKAREQIARDGPHGISQRHL